MTRKKKHRCPAMALWMTTFTDMTTLLLTFFILMFTTAEIDGQKLKLILSSFAGSFGVMKGGFTLVEGPLAEMGFTVEKLPSTENSNKLMSHKNIAENQFKAMVQKGQLKLENSKRGLTISLPAQVFFKPGSVEITKDGVLILDKIGEFLVNLKIRRNIDRQIIIQGYASQEPKFLVNESATVSNIWEYNMRLASGRAENVLVFLVRKFVNSQIAPYIASGSVEKNVQSRFVAESYGEFAPLDSNEVPETRIWNRRVDILVRKGLIQ